MFLGTLVLLCDFHREQAWERWCSKGSNSVVAIKDDVLSYLRRLAHAKDEETFEAALKSFQLSPIWKKSSSEKLRTWFTQYWLPEKQVSRI